MKRKFTNSGFTIIEILIAIFIFVVISIGIVALASNLLLSSARQSNLLADSDQARKISNNIINELRKAEVSSIGSYPLATADAQTVVFYSNIDSDSYIERVRYYVQDGKLYKGILKPSGNPLTYSQSNEKTNLVQNELANGNDPLFYYYNGDYDSSTDDFLSQPVSVTEVKYIKLNLKIYNKGGVKNTNSYTVTAAGSIRNLKDNLGDPGVPDYFYTLNSQVLPQSAGSVSVSPAGPSYAEQTLVNLNASANLGYAFSSWTGDVNNATSATSTIVMSSDKNITANFVTLDQTLTGSISAKNGSQSARRWTLRINNPNAYTVSSVNLYSFNLTQTAGSSCSPVITSGGDFPVTMGNISAGGYRTQQITINFSGCSAASRFTVNFTYAGNLGANWGSTTIANQQY